MITKSQVKYIQSLGQKQFRDQEMAFVAEGPKIINELLASSIELIQLLATNEYALPATIKAETIIVSQVELARISFLQTPNQVLGIFKKRETVQQPVINNGISLLLDDIQDPGNMGTLIRIADWFGIQTVFCSVASADAYAPKVVQATMGSIVRVEVVSTDLVQLVEQSPDIPVYTAVLGGVSLYEIKKTVNAAIVIGNESRGVSAAIQQLSYKAISIPAIGKAESLNAAVAAGIVLSHWRAGMM
jgi:TrmH family RNA methyltransferase